MTYFKSKKERCTKLKKNKKLNLKKKNSSGERQRENYFHLF